MKTRTFPSLFFSILFQDLHVGSIAELSNHREGIFTDYDHFLNTQFPFYLLLPFSFFFLSSSLFLTILSSFPSLSFPCHPLLSSLIPLFLPSSLILLLSILLPIRSSFHHILMVSKNKSLP